MGDVLHAKESCLFLNCANLTFEVDLAKVHRKTKFICVIFSKGEDDIPESNKKVVDANTKWLKQYGHDVIFAVDESVVKGLLSLPCLKNVVFHGANSSHIQSSS